MDQLIIGDKASFDDFFASLAKRDIGMPAKKSIKETVPFSNITYDFSAINGELYWEERELEYIFEIIMPTPEKLEEAKTAFASWVMNVQNEEIHDPFIPDYHFVGTFDEIEFEDEESLDKTTVSVTFTAYPYKVANALTEYEYTVDPHSIRDIYIPNNSSHRVVPSFVADGEIFLTNEEILVGDTEIVVDGLYLEKGNNPLTIQDASALNNGSTLFVRFREEVF